MYFWLFTFTENINFTLRLESFEPRLRFLMIILYFSKYTTISSTENNDVSLLLFWMKGIPILDIYARSKLQCLLTPLQKINLSEKKKKKKEGLFFFLGRQVWSDLCECELLLQKINQIVNLIEVIRNPIEWRPENLLNVDHLQKASLNCG